MVSLRKLAGAKIPLLPYELIAEDILGAFFDLSIAFVGASESRRLNFKYRGVDSPTNVLSFPLDEDSGELIFSQELCMSEAKGFEINFEAYLTYLLIHGLLHLKGQDHGSKMTSEEKKFVTKYCTKDRDLITENFL